MNTYTHIILSPQDNVGIAVTHNLTKEQIVQTNSDTIVLQNNIPFGHKFALQNIPKGNPVLKYGQIIGITKRDIVKGEHIHVNEIQYLSKSNQFFIENNFQNVRKAENLPSTFLGYPRRDGRVGTRNYVVVVSSVNCSATVVKKITRTFENHTDLKNIDGVVPITYDGGCAQAFNSKSHHLISRTIAGWVDHPNVVAAIIIGLGCETINIQSILEKIPDYKQKNIYHFNIQDVGGSGKAIELGIKIVNEQLQTLPVFERQEVPVEHLLLGLNCGGSDTFSGLTANPALGVASDVLVSKKGTAVLAETPECNGAEEHLMNRCVKNEDREKLKKIVNWWADYTSFHHVELNDNLSKGNMEGGISTILEKSLGAIAKAGHEPIQEILDYAEKIKQKGLLFMDTPGFDPVSVTGLIAGGCNMVAFTTGRGSMFNASIVPTIKISTNSELKNRLPDDMDIDAGVILQGRSVEEVGVDIYKEIVAVASGKRTKGEKQLLGTEEFVPWQFGEIL